MKKLITLGVKEYRCECCGITEWNGREIKLQIHHIDGDHFNNELEKPKFEINHLKNCLGQYHWRYDWFGTLIESVIRISDVYDRTEDEIVNTIAHEMIHLYIRQILKGNV